MSKQSLQRTAKRNSGISYQESVEAIELKDPSIYERIGKEDGFKRLSELFYERVFDSGSDSSSSGSSSNNNNNTQWFLNIFSSSTKNEAIDNQYRFLVQTFGGPELYKEKKGKYTRLAGRHANYNIGTRAARQWVEYMNDAIDEHENLKDDDEAREHLKKYFTYTAHYIVAAMEYMRPDQLSGGTKIDSDRVW